MRNIFFHLPYRWLFPHLMRGRKVGMTPSRGSQPGVIAYCRSCRRDSPCLLTVLAVKGDGEFWFNKAPGTITQPEPPDNPTP